MMHLKWLARSAGLAAMLCAFLVSAAAPAPGIQLSATVVRQGEAVEVTVATAAVGANAVVRFAGRVWPLFSIGSGRLRTYLGTDPFTAPGARRITVESPNGAVLFARTLTVRKRSFPTRRLRFDPDKVALLDPKLLAIERQKVGAALRALAPDQIWEHPFIIPVEGRRTSPYGVISVYQGKPRGWHRGTDFAAPIGTPVYAANHGIVRLAELLPVSGNAIFIDHGLGIVTSYLHLSAVHVRTGQRVRRGTMVGAVGSTGLATGPHLHWGLRTNGLLVDPLPWAEEPPGR
ncbi:MAG TPA: M23 family metallopeptidase [bacterium]|nr:M23 family metallopeptidase [bacterium]